MDAAQKIRELASLLVDIFGDGDILMHRHGMEIYFKKHALRLQLNPVHQGFEISLNSNTGQIAAPFFWDENASVRTAAQRIREAFTGQSIESELGKS